jgi:hypothetical protein
MEAEDAIQRGDRLLAYQLSLEATQIAPQEIETWLMRAETAPSTEEAVTCLNQANALLPSDAAVKQKTYQMIQKLINQDPFVLYLDETDHLYHVRSGGQLSLSVFKDRSIPEPYPVKRPVLLQHAYRWLWMAFLGLALAGLGALIFAPLAAISAIALSLTHTSKQSSKAYSIHSLLVLILSGSLWLCGLLLFVILLVHIV